jgi:hypothetical protein
VELALFPIFRAHKNKEKTFYTTTTEKGHEIRKEGDISRAAVIWWDSLG